jgi:RNA polymerase sigma-70 factor (ECF subfamily)
MQQQIRSSARKNNVVYLLGTRSTRETTSPQKSHEAQPGDESLLLTYIAREEYALAVEVLVQEHQDAIISYCYSHFPDRPIALDVAQEIFLAVFESLPRFRGDSSVKTWLYGIASKKCLEVGRTKGRRETLVRDNHLSIASTTHGEPPRQPEEVCYQERQRQRVWKALKRLRVYDRELLVLRYLDELTYDEMASILKVSRRTVERHLPRAESKFLKAYEKVLGV